MNPLAVSTIIPTYNRADMLGRALSSVVSQIGPQDEIVVVDDGSTDHTEDIVAAFGGRVRYFRTCHGGAGAARNFGVRQARCPLVAFLDSDDEWMAGKMDLQRQIMAALPDVLFCFSNISWRKRDGSELRFSLSTWPGHILGWEQIFGPGRPASGLIALPDGMDDFLYYIGNLYLPLLTACYMTVITLMVRREAAGEALQFAEDLKTYEDWECFARLAHAGDCAYLHCETAWNHAHRGSRLTDSDGFDRAIALATIIERVWGSDPRFLCRHSDVYLHTLKEHRLSIAAGLILRGRKSEAHVQLTELRDVPLRYRLAVALPGPLAEYLGKLYVGSTHLYKGIRTSAFLNRPRLNGAIDGKGE